MATTLKGNSGNIFGLSSDEKVKVDDQEANAQDGDADEEEDRLLMSKEPTEKYQEFDDLEDDDDFNDYNKDNVDHDKPKFNQTDLEGDTQKENKDKQISKNVNTVVNEEQQLDQPDTDK